MAATDTLTTLTTTVFDSVEGYRQAMTKAQSPALKTALQERLTKREQTLATLNAGLDRLGAARVMKGSVTGDLHRRWLGIADMFENGDEAAAERVEEGEDYLLKKFEEASRETGLDPQVRTVIEQCLPEIREGEQFGDMIEKQYD